MAKENMAVAVNIQQTVSPVDALWTLFQGQTKAIRKAFIERLQQSQEQAKTARQQQMIKDSLTRAFKELEEVQRNGTKLPDAHDLFK